MGYIKRAQATTNPPGNPSYWFRHKSKGSWPLSTVDYGWASSDTTAEVTKNKDGSVSTLECQRTYSWLEVWHVLSNDETIQIVTYIEILNPAESFRNIVADYSTVECTSSVLQALVLFGDFNSEYRSKEIKENVDKAAIFIESNQNKDGSWYGTWGICFIYGTLHAINGLVAAGRNYENNICIRKACEFLLSIQLKTGGWAESYRSCERQVRKKYCYYTSYNLSSLTIFLHFVYRNMSATPTALYTSTTPTTVFCSLFGLLESITAKYVPKLIEGIHGIQKSHM
ncbi:Cycloartenol synthase [Zea mays]|uniref:Cycloartenol synthase n=1 Tax=Zea mays TaxID=4577 RepID=A0A317Y6R6_MAIZE|nr:Cycloartenol synthase [Zea mays]